MSTVLVDAITEEQYDRLCIVLIRLTLRETPINSAKIDWLLEVFAACENSGLRRIPLLMTYTRCQELNVMVNAYDEHCSADLTNLRYSELLYAYYLQLPKLQGLRFCSK